MSRASTTSDAFNAIAEPRRREIIDLLKGGEAFAVGDLVTKLKLAQPAVSKHLGVLKKVGLVSVSKQGQHRFYRLEAEQLKPVDAWIQQYRQHWDQSLDRLGAYLKVLQAKPESPSAEQPPTT